MKKKLLSLMICCIMLTGCGAAPTQGLSEQDIKSKEDTLKDSQAHVDVEETFITKFDGTNAIQTDDEGLLLSHCFRDTPFMLKIYEIS